MHKYTEEEKQFLVDNAKGILTSELTRLFNEKFGTELRLSQIRSIKKKYKIRSGVDTKYKIRSGVDTRYKCEPPKSSMQVIETLCWSCRRATNIDGGCSWSKELKPVRDWEAEERVLNDNGMKHGNTTYLVVKCPLYLKDGRDLQYTIQRLLSYI